MRGSRNRTLENVSERLQLNHFVCLFTIYDGLNQVQGLIVGDGNNRYEFPPFFSGLVHDDDEVGWVHMAGEDSVFPLLHKHQNDRYARLAGREGLTRQLQRGSRDFPAITR